MTAVRTDAGRISRAYSAVERLEDFGPGELLAYRRDRMRQCERHVRAVERLLGRGPSRVLDIGSGSSALAYRLDDAGLLDSADCVEPSPSRHGFAERWKRDEGRARIRNHASDALGFLVGAGRPGDGYDAILCVDHTMAYLAVFYSAKALDRLIGSWSRALKPGGVVLVEVTLYPEVRRALEAWGWEKVQAFDETPKGRFRYSLSEYRLERRGRIGVRSLYLASDGRSLVKEEVSRLFTKAELEALFARRGFRRLAAWDGATGRPYRLGDESVMLAFGNPPAAGRAREGRG
jgi:SAM-dependent methyltransferase